MTICVLLLSFFSLSYGAVYYYVITPEELKLRIDDPQDEKFIIIDVSKQSDYETAHIPGAVSIPLKELGYRVWSLDKLQDIIVYCQKNIQSKIAAQILNNAGFKDVYNLEGGFKSWDYAVESVYGRVDV